MVRKKEMCVGGVLVKHAALDDDENGEVILRGVIDPESLKNLQTDDYQREILPLAKISELVEAFRKGSVPDIDLGMRGHKCSGEGEVYCLNDLVYIIDGLQRVTAAMKMMQEGGEKLPRLGATIHFGTTKKWEKERFRILNAERTRLSSNVLLRNLKDDMGIVKTLYSLSSNKNFVLRNRVCWSQRMKRNELITAMTFMKVVGALHCHLGPGLYTNWQDLAGGIQKISNNIGINPVKENTKTFFDLIERCWGIQRIAFKEGAVYMRSGFLITLAKVLSAHKSFWKGEKDQRLYIESHLAKKIAIFPINDPQVSQLASSGKSQDLLFLLMVRHINSGKRTRRLIPRKESDIPEDVEEMEEIMEENGDTVEA